MLPAGNACLVAETTTPIVTLNGSPVNCSVLLSFFQDLFSNLNVHSRRCVLFTSKGVLYKASRLQEFFFQFSFDVENLILCITLTFVF